MFYKFFKQIVERNGKYMMPKEAYDLWAEQYDQQNTNLVLWLDNEIVNDLLQGLNLKNKNILDFGCGTGRYWNQITALKPNDIRGFDISKSMLEILKKKFPAASTVLVEDHLLSGIENNSIDFIFSTLVLGHLPDLEKSFHEWNRVLKPGGEILFTEFHPEALKRGETRSFMFRGNKIKVWNRIHTINDIIRYTEKCGWDLQKFEEKLIDDSVLNFYIRTNSTHLFKRNKNRPLIFGMLLKKRYDNS